MPKMSIVSRITEYEAGELSPEETYQFFCDLANWDMLSQLQGSYQRTFIALRRDHRIGAGKLDGKMTWCVAPSFEDIENWMNDGGSEAVACGCWVEPDGECACGNPSWLRYWGMI